LHIRDDELRFAANRTNLTGLRGYTPLLRFPAVARVLVVRLILRLRWLTRS
jgi:hypothetical protein